MLGNDQHLNGWGDGTAQQVMDAIVQCSNTGGGTVYLYGRTYTGEATLSAGQGQMRYINNVKVVGGDPDNPNQVAKFTGNNVFTFTGYSQDIPGVQTSVTLPWGQVIYMGVAGFYSNSGVNLNNVIFENLEFENRAFAFKSGSLTNCVFNNINTSNHLFFLYGCYFDNSPIPVTNCNFTNCHQTFEGRNPEAGTDGDGQLGAVFGAKLVGCNFINTSSATHGGAFCLSDESEWGAQCVASSITDCNFINITSRWFAVYIHGNFSTTVYFNDRPQVIDNCNFINCTGTGEYGGAVGISHNNLIIRDSNFINNTGGQGAAVMVGGIDRNHDGFNGRNTQGNNITIENCYFEGNVAKIENQSSSVSPDHGNFEGHPTGNAGAIYIYGNDTKILNSTFDSNIAASGEGAAIYIHGERTQINDSEFYNHESDRGAVYIEGGNTHISDSTFENNTAENGAGVYIEGSNTVIDGSTFENNTAVNGSGVYIEGSNTVISGSDFDSNNASENGAGVYIKGDNTKIISGSSFENNTAVNGAGVYVVGKSTEFSDSTYEYNNATNGGAIYINGQSSTINSNTFDHNNVSNHGGAVYIEGSGTSISSNTFTNNEAVAISADGTEGLGGAIYVKGDNTKTDSNDFEHNKARNGSAIYTDGTNFILTGDTFKENQAWSYLLIVTPKPEESYYNQSDVNITVVHVGGDNIINAIHNTADHNDITFNHVSYQNSHGDIETTGNNEHPVASAELSNNGTRTYQDDREFLQKIIITKILDEDGNNLLDEPYVAYSNITGEIRLTIKKPIKVGNYTVYAEHPEDWNYKYIGNESKFRVLPLVDLDTNKTSDKDVYYIGDIVVWTIKVHNAANGTNATNVTLKDVLPSGFTFINATATKGSYSNATKTWTIGNMTNGTTETLTINSRAINNGTYTNEVNVTSNEKDWNVSNDVNNKTVIVYRPNMTVEKVSLNASDIVYVNNTVAFNITVRNTGDCNLTNVTVVEGYKTSEFAYLNHSNKDVWNKSGDVFTYQGTLLKGENLTFTVWFKALTNGTLVNNVTAKSNKTNETNSSANVTVYLPNMTVVKVSLNTSHVNVNETVAFNITVTNTGDCDLTNVVVTEFFNSTELEYLKATGVGWTNSSNVFTYVNLAKGASASFTVWFKTLTNGTLVNNVTAKSDQTNETNSSANVTVDPICDLVINKTVNASVINLNESVSWTITVVNNGPSVAKDVVVTDTLDAGLEKW